MVWGAFCQHGKSDLALLNGRQTAQHYIQTLENDLVPFATKFYGQNYIFQQDNASIHTAKRTKTWFNEQKIEVMDWPAVSPDLNPIENIWGILARRVYHNGRQFQRRDELVGAILKAWDEIDDEILKKLVSTMQQRCIFVLEKKGATIKY